MTVAEYIASFLANKGVDTVFSVSGGGCVFLLDAMSRNQNIKVIANHHEQSSAMAAEGYARIKNDIGACLLTSGPGGFNAFTGVLCSYQDSTPTFIISGNVKKEMTTNFTGLNLRQLGDQEFNVVKVAANFTKYAIQVNEPNKIKYHLEKAYFLCKSGRPGPVWIDVPLDVQNAKIDPLKIESYIPKNIKKELSDITTNNIIEKLHSSVRPLIIVGNGIRLSGAVISFNEFLKKHKIPVVTSLNGNDIVHSDYDYNFGRFGTVGQITPNKLIQECDLLLSIGSRLYVRQIGYNFKGFAKKAFKIYVDIDNDELNKPTLHPDIKVNMDAKDFIDNVLSKVEYDNYSLWKDYCHEMREKHPIIREKTKNQSPLSVYWALYEIKNYVTENYSYVTSGAGQNIQGNQIIRLINDQRLITNKSTAPMGYGLPAAIGAYYGSKKPIICIEGDGSIQMNIQELQVLYQNQLPIKVIIINNNGYSCIRITQNNFCNGNESIAGPESGLTLPNYKDLANAYKIQYHSIKNSNDLHKVYSEVFSREKHVPEIIEIFVDQNELHEPKVISKLDKNGVFSSPNLDDIDWITN